MKHKSRKMLMEILGFSVWSMIITIAQRLIFNIIPTILGAFSGSISIAVFGAASTLEGFVYTFSTGINDLFLPKVSRIVLKDDNQGLLTLMIKVGRVQFVIIGLLFTGFLTIGRDFINLWLGAGFESAYLCTLLLILPSLIELPQHIAGLAVIAVNKVRSKSLIFILTSVLNVVLSIILTLKIGVLGAAVSISAAYLLRTAAMNVLYYRQLNINIFMFFKECHIKMSLAFILSILTGFLLPKLIAVNGWLTLGIKGLFITTAYVLFMWLFALNTYEKDLFFSVGRRLIQKILNK
jgi:O-antigen/teichoic acid export membrane protein